MNEGLIDERIRYLSQQKTSINDSEAESQETTYSASKIEERLSEIPSGGIEEAPIDGNQYARKDAGWEEVVAGGHTQNTDTGTTGNTFTVDSDSTTGKIIVDVALGAADLSLTLTNEALTSTSKTATFPNKTGTVAMTSDIPVKATGTDIDNATDDAKFATAKALADSAIILTPAKISSLAEIESFNESDHTFIILNINDGLMYKGSLALLRNYFDTLYTPL